ncbi:MAG: LolA family protein [Planctomycetota bacterium]|jgi:hypothetical protein
MKHTGAKPLMWLGLVLIQGAAQGLPAQPGQDPQPPTVGQLLKTLQTREKAVKSVEIEFSVQDRFPNNRRFESRGTLRVLHRTHFQTAVQVSFDDEVRSEMQTVVTPDGVWTRQKSPIEDVFLFTKPELRKEMEQKTRKLGETTRLPGPMSTPQGGVLGGAMLLALSRQFDLKVAGRQVVDKVSCLVLDGDRRQSKAGDDTGEQDQRESPLAQPVPEKATVIVREADAIPIRMTQFGADGKPMVSFQIHKLVLDAELDTSSFKIDKPEGATFIDIEKHPPSWAQILRVREAYAELEEKEKTKRESEKDRPASQPADTRKGPGK